MLTQFLQGNYSIYLTDIYSVMHDYFNTVMDKLQTSTVVSQIIC